MAANTRTPSMRVDKFSRCILPILPKPKIPMFINVVVFGVKVKTVKTTDLNKKLKCQELAYLTVYQITIIKKSSVI
jgi:hypothetical protein